MEKSGNTLNTRALIKKDMQFPMKRDSISILRISRKTTHPSVQNVERKPENMNKTERTLWKRCNLIRAFNKKYLLVKGVALVLAAGFALSAGYTLHNVQMQQEIASHIIRFHVRANSDSSVDQTLKLKVRDGIGTMMEERLENAQSLADSRRIIRESLTDIEDRSEEILRKNGCENAVTASLTDAWFPVKSYGNSVFPMFPYRLSIFEN